MTPKGSANRRYPKAYLNWIFLDDQFNYFSSLSGSVLAASSTYPAGSMNLVALGGPIALNKSGYLYIWVSNETTGWDVYYDNLSVQYKQGPLLEENHYYPFGLTMAGISDKALKTNYAENKYRYNKGSELQNKEFSDGSGLEMYETFYRSLDPQLGRFWQIDPKPNPDFSPYASMEDDPILHNDPFGDSLLTKADQRMAGRITKEVNSRNASLNKQAAKLNSQIAKAQAKGNTNRVNSLQGKLNDVSASVNTNNTTLSHLNAITNDQTQAYTFNQLPAGSTEGGTVEKTMNVNGNNQGVIVMNVLSDANAVHELTHAWQGGVDGDFGFNLDNAANPITFVGRTRFDQQMANANSEIAAYQAQYAFDPGTMPSSTMGSTPSSMNGITSFYVGGLNGTNAQGGSVPLYPNVRNMVGTILSLLGVGF